MHIGLGIGALLWAILSVGFSVYFGKDTSLEGRMQARRICMILLMLLLLLNMFLIWVLFNDEKICKRREFSWMKGEDIKSYQISRGGQGTRKSSIKQSKSLRSDYGQGNKSKGGILGGNKKHDENMGSKWSIKPKRPDIRTKSNVEMREPEKIKDEEQPKIDTEAN